MLNQLLGTKFRVIEGYKGITDAALAIERGEVQGVCMSLAQFNNYEHLIRADKLRILFHAEETPVITGSVGAVRSISAVADDHGETLPT